MSRLAGLFVVVILATGCARGKIDGIRIDLRPGSIAKSDLMVVKDMSADDAVFTGDKAADTQRVADEKAWIKQRLASRIVTSLLAVGYRSEKHNGQEGNDVILVEGQVTKFDHGSGAARALIGMGAGSSNLFVTVKATKGGQAIADFDVVATSGGRGGLMAMSSFLDAHLEDAAEAIASHLTKSE